MAGIHPTRGGEKAPLSIIFAHQTPQPDTFI